MHHSAYSTAQMTNYEQPGIHQGRDVWGGCFLNAMSHKLTHNCFVIDVISTVKEAKLNITVSYGQ